MDSLLGGGIVDVTVGCVERLQSIGQLLLVLEFHRLTVALVEAVLAVAGISRLLDRWNGVASDQLIRKTDRLSGQVLQQHLILPHSVTQVVQFLLLHPFQLMNSFIEFIAHFERCQRIDFCALADINEVGCVLEYFKLPCLSLLNVQVLHPRISFLQHVARLCLINLKLSVRIVLDSHFGVPIFHENFSFLFIKVLPSYVAIDPVLHFLVLDLCVLLVEPLLLHDHVLLLALFDLFKLIVEVKCLS